MITLSIALVFIALSIWLIALKISLVYENRGKRKTKISAADSQDAVLHKLQQSIENYRAENRNLRERVEIANRKVHALESIKTAPLLLPEGVEVNGIGSDGHTLMYTIRVKDADYEKNIEYMKKALAASYSVPTMVLSGGATIQRLPMNQRLAIPSPPPVPKPPLVYYHEGYWGEPSSLAERDCLNKIKEIEKDIKERPLEKIIADAERVAVEEFNANQV